MGDGLTRLARPDDAAALAAVHTVTWQRAYRGILSDQFLDSMDVGAREAWWARYLARGSAQVAEVGGRVIGFCTAGPSDESGWGEVFAIYVHPDHWGSGVGRDLLAAGESTITEGGLDRALLWVLEANSRARAFYERQGWSLGKPIRVEAIGGVQVNEVRYEKDL